MTQLVNKGILNFHSIYYQPFHSHSLETLKFAFNKDLDIYFLRKNDTDSPEDPQTTYPVMFKHL